MRYSPSQTILVAAHDAHATSMEPQLERNLEADARASSSDKGNLAVQHVVLERTDCPLDAFV